MEVEEFNSFYHVDTSVQIDNNWNDDTALGIVKDLRKYSIMIRGRDKEVIKRRFVLGENSDSSKKHNKKIVALVYSYLLYRSLCEFQEARPLLLCRDVRPERLVIHYFQKISNFFNRQDIFNRKIEFRKREDRNQKKLPKSLAGKYVRKVYQGKIQATAILNGNDLDELIEVINKLL